ncbi:MAG: DUF2892 domain-containing protein [Lewinella sp.]|nr:DUF2892 domain-containing protein [Lewinella sp.]
MKKNVGNTDRIIRVIVALVIAALLFTKTVLISSVLGIILAVVGVIFLFTSAVSWCAIYAVIGASTCPVETE